MIEFGKKHPYSEAVQAFADDLALLDSALAHAVAAQAQEMVRLAFLRQEIEKARNSGPSLDGEQVFAELLAEADADIAAANLTLRPT